MVPADRSLVGAHEALGTFHDDARPNRRRDPRAASPSRTPPRRRRDRLERVDDVVLHANDARRIRLESHRNRQPQRLQLAGIREAGVDDEQRLKRANHQARAHEQHERERDLRDDERALRAMLTAPAARAARAALESCDDARPGNLQRGYRSEHEAGQQRHAQRRAQRPANRARSRARRGSVVGPNRASSPSAP